MGESFLDLRGSYENFLRGERNRFNLKDRIGAALDDYRHMIDNSQKGAGGVDTNAAAGAACPRVAIRLAELRAEGDGTLWRRLRVDPLRHLRALEAACHLIAQEERPGYDKEGARVKVALTGPVGAAASSPRQLTSATLRQLVCVEGVATKVSVIKPKVVRSVHYNTGTHQYNQRDYIDATDPNLGLPEVDSSGMEKPDRIVNITNSVYPTKDSQNNPLETEFGLSIFKDHQTITLQEMPEKAPMGQLPRSVELVLDHDLVDRVKPGDRVMVVGVYRALATSGQGQQTSSGVFRTVVLVNNVQILGRDVSHLNFSSHDVRVIKELSKRDDILNILGRSIAPSIYGHDVIKKALALQLLSGAEKNLENGTHLRGDINILMVGDPSTAKSQLLRSAMTIAPLAVSTTGKGSSGVGLTAAVTSDPDTGERRLEAGAMVLADRGLVCVDEFDKMGENDRVAIHEAMEQQTISVAKAGIHASLNARCSVLAAANPVYGQYDKQRRIQENIGLPDSLLSRFDLLFVVLDQMDPTLDRSIASHVILAHRYRRERGKDHGTDDRDDEDDDALDDSPDRRANSVWQRNRQASRKALLDDDSDDEDDDDDDLHANDVLQHDFLRKFLHFAKTRCHPVLTESARDYIAHAYADMRARQNEHRTLPVTARSLETVIRLATAHAKARLSRTVDAKPDCQVAMDILNFALYHEHINNDGSQESAQKDVAMEDANNDAGNPAIGSDETMKDSNDENEEPEDLRSRKRVRLTKENDLKTTIWDALTENDGQLEIDAALEDGSLGDPQAVRAMLESMEKDGLIEISDGIAIVI